MTTLLVGKMTVGTERWVSELRTTSEGRGITGAEVCDFDIAGAGGAAQSCRSRVCGARSQTKSTTVHPAGATVKGNQAQRTGTGAVVPSERARARRAGGTAIRFLRR